MGKWVAGRSLGAGWEVKEQMKKYVLILAALWTAHTVIAQTSQDNRPRPTPTPPPTEVYATASDGTRLEWDVYAPKGTGPWPAVLVIHGGNFYGGSPDDAGVSGCAQDLADAGYIALVIT